MNIKKEYNDLFFSSKGTNDKAKIGIRMKNGKIKRMSVQEVFNTYFIGSREAERKMLVTLQQLGADVKDIIQVLDIYNTDYQSEIDYKFNQDQWESDENEKIRKEKYGDISEKEFNEVNTIISVQGLTASVYRDLRQLFFFEKFHERKLTMGDKEKEFMQQRLDSFGNITESDPDLSKMMIYRTMGETEFKGISEWAKKHKRMGGEIKSYLTFRHSIMDENVPNDEDIPDDIPVQNHLGGYSQAKQYAKADAGYKFLLQFTLKKNARELLGDPEQLVLQKASKNTTTSKIKSWLDNHEMQVEEVKSGEAHKAGKIGLKNENKGGEALSISLGRNKETQRVFQRLLKRVDLIEVIAPK
ncbi:hypothetical protein HNP24_002081 [Chryseobacterium sediminis]|uniref:Uncharacterized protein n=1 Tax=Chryseobacterium sediminis TaxID=1679494 RepID=A0ABR6PZI9_9FLAO|nr:hypothetical protein [Chryseobacterium sediminis]MBB6331131.1 hypothetical protein [Chryseobacterium sediminis]